MQCAGGERPSVRLAQALPHGTTLALRRDDYPVAVGPGWQRGHQ